MMHQGTGHGVWGVEVVIDERILLGRGRSLSFIMFPHLGTAKLIQRR